MKEELEALQARCESLVEWLEGKKIQPVNEEDMELFSFLLHKSSQEIGSSGMHATTERGLMKAIAGAFLAGYKKGYEVRNIEVLAE